MAKFYVTFGYNQPYRDYYYVITAKDYEDAKRRAIKIFGDNYSLIYHSADEAGIESYGLKRLHWYNLPLIGRI